MDTAHLLVTDTLSRRSLYVGLTRGRESNTAHIVTGNTAPPGHLSYAQASPESVVKEILERDDADLSATEQIRQAQERVWGTGHLLTSVVRRGPAVALPADRPADQGPAHRIRSLPVRPGTLPPSPPPAAARRPARRTRHQLDHQSDHRRADGPSPVHLQRPARPPPAAPSARSRPRSDMGPAHTERRARSGARAGRRAGPRARALGEQLAASPEPWLVSQLGVLAPHASPLLREDYARRAASRRGLPGSRRDHRPRPGHRPRTPPRQPRTRPPAPGRDPRPGTTRRNRDHPPHEPWRARGPDP